MLAGGMVITVIGGSHGTGAELVQTALTQGHSVTCVSRSGVAVDGVRDVRGDARDPAVLAEALAGADAVVITVGAARGTDTNRTEVTRAAIKAMTSAGPRRLIVQSSLGVGDSKNLLPGPLRLFANVALGKAFADHSGQEAAVGSCPLDWTLVRPGGLTNGPATGEFIAREGLGATPMKTRISRTDLAGYLLQIVDDPFSFGRAMVVGTPKSAA